MMNAAHPQIPFSFRLLELFTFDNFVVGSNQVIVQQLQQQLTPTGDPLVYLWGVEGAGCSHLLQAACQQATAQQKTAIYLPMNEIRNFDPAMLQGVEGVDLICIDHLQAVVGEVEWEEALFHLFNRVLQQQSALLVGATQPPRGIGIQLPDLLSRLASCAVFQVSPLNDEEKTVLLQEKAAEKGIELSAEAAHYILNRSERSTGRLLDILDRLDHSSLSAGRKLTIPFIKESMSW